MLTTKTNIASLLQYLIVVLSITKLPSCHGMSSPLTVSEELGCSPTLTTVYKTITSKKDNNKKKNEKFDLKNIIFTNNDDDDDIDLVKDAYFFDPLRLARDENFSRYREAELKHGRVAMLAWIGLYFSNTATMVPEEEEVVEGEAIVEFSWNILSSIQQVTLTQYLQIAITCGILETLVFVQRNPQDMPGDYGIGYFGIRDKGFHERSLISELENGRLAMMTFGMVAGMELYHDPTFQEELKELLVKLLAATTGTVVAPIN